MTTTTSTTTLVEVMRERWRTGSKRSDSEWPDARITALHALELALVGDYWTYDDPPDGSTDDPMAPEWLQELRTEIINVGMDAFEAHVVPAVIAAVEAYLPTAPDYLRAFPQSEQLRADLARLAAER